MRTPFLALLFFVSTLAAAQQVGPLRQEFRTKVGKPVHGWFLVHNVGHEPMVVTVEPMSFSAKDGIVDLAALARGIEIKLSDTGFRLGPEQERRVFFSATCQTLPCYFQLFASMTSGPHRTEGLQVAVHIPSVVYVCDKEDKAQSHCRDYVRTTIFHEPPDNLALPRPR
jgi:hypothetical protein